jgi:hypothetical protein
LVVTSSDCNATVEYWSPTQRDCLTCPTYPKVEFSKGALESGVDFSNGSVVFTSLSQDSGRRTATIQINNVELFAVSVTQQPTISSWIEISSSKGNLLSGLSLQSGESVDIDITVDPIGLRGLSVSSILFRVANSSLYASCQAIDMKLDISVELQPNANMNYLGSFRFVGFVLGGVVMLASIIFAFIVAQRRKTHLVSKMQPAFLHALCFGVCMIGSSLIPFSFDDEIASQQGCSRACNAVAWLLSLGFTITMATLFSKLWRINRLFGEQQFRRVQVKVMDVMLPFATLFTLNFAFLLAWTIADPLQWTRQSIQGQPWNTFGTCQSSGKVGTSMMTLVGVTDGIALVLAFYQAYKARNINSEFSEAKYLGIALYSWIQIAIVVGPMLFLVRKDDPISRYFLIVAVLFATCIGMLLLIFVPMLIFQNDRLNTGSVRVSGLNIGNNKPSTSSVNHPSGHAGPSLSGEEATDS